MVKQVRRFEAEPRHEFPFAGMGSHVGEAVGFVAEKLIEVDGGRDIKYESGHGVGGFTGLAEQLTSSFVGSGSAPVCRGNCDVRIEVDMSEPRDPQGAIVAECPLRTFKKRADAEAYEGSCATVHQQVPASFAAHIVGVVGTITNEEETIRNAQADITAARERIDRALGY